MLGSMINSANTSSRSNFCNYCGKDNYTILKIVFERMDPIFSTNKGGRGGRGSYGRGNTGGRSNKICTHCGTTNHTVDECYKKHGYPLGYILYKPQGVTINNTVAEVENNDNQTQEK